ncbi:hypothetical protein BT96DRAFT_1010960 [Gymnopus androsaceus JB14]|uniref:Uncharacterized protein n=1 Tax=Gymnopus androsaceus JB14 TaxID=1447944 RepID=A0A6A4GA00_9AGAR|nr:hypothetical protein BT96DRAFT_1010960 [Gymnopus androsaceus JB14]
MSRVDRETLATGCVDQTEIFSSTRALHAHDHSLLPSFRLGPIRTPKGLRRSISPYSSLSSYLSSSASSGSPSSSSFLSEFDSDSEADSQTDDEELESKAGSCSSESAPIHRSMPSQTPSRDEMVQRDSTTVPAKHRRTKRSVPAPMPVKIPKPAGEVGRPGRGGYNLEVALGWQKEKFTRVKNVIKQLVVGDLSCELSFSKQLLVKIQHIRDEAVKKLPMLEDYQDLWVIQEPDELS